MPLWPDDAASVASSACSFHTTVDPESPPPLPPAETPRSEPKPPPKAVSLCARALSSSGSDLSSAVTEPASPPGPVKRRKRLRPNQAARRLQAFARGFLTRRRVKLARALGPRPPLLQCPACGIEHSLKPAQRAALVRQGFDNPQHCQRCFYRLHPKRGPPGRGVPCQDCGRPWRLPAELRARFADVRCPPCHYKHRGKVWVGTARAAVPMGVLHWAARKLQAAWRRRYLARRWTGVRNIARRLRIDRLARTLQRALRGRRLMGMLLQAMRERAALQLQLTWRRHRARQALRRRRDEAAQGRPLNLQTPASPSLNPRAASFAPPGFAETPQFRGRSLEEQLYRAKAAQQLLVQQSHFAREALAMAQHSARCYEQRARSLQEENAALAQRLYVLEARLGVLTFEQEFPALTCGPFPMVWQPQWPVPQALQKGC